MKVTTQCPTRENGLAHLSAIGPDGILRREHAREKAAASEGAASRASQRNLREKFRLGYADIGVRGNEHLLSLANVRPALEQRGREPRRNIRREDLLFERLPALHAVRVLAEENADGVFFLADKSLEVRNLSICSVQHLLCLEHIELGGHTVVQAEGR